MSISTEHSQVIAPAMAEQALIAQTCSELFREPRLRPHPLDIASLITNGVNEDAVIAAGESKYPQMPMMNKMAANLRTALPFLQQVSDRLATDHAKDVILFAGRDAEVLHDDFAITHPDVKSELLPASGQLWCSGTMRIRWLARAFLDRYGVTEETVSPENPTRFVLVDSGFEGSIGDHLSQHVDRLYGTSPLQTGKLAVKLVSAKAGKKSIIDLSDEEISLERWATDDSNHNLACYMQVMPRYHGPYRHLKLSRSGITAMPSRSTHRNKYSDDKFTNNVDAATRRHNASIVNPVAAALVQLRVVKAAMERREAYSTEPAHVT